MDGAYFGFTYHQETKSSEQVTDPFKMVVFFEQIYLSANFICRKAIELCLVMNIAFTTAFGLSNGDVLLPFSMQKP